MDFNPLNGEGNPFSEAARIAAIAALTGGAALGGALTHSRGKIYNIPLKMILKNPKESYKYAIKGGYDAIDPEMLSKAIATKDIPRSFTSKSELAPNYFFGKEIPNTPQADGFNDINIVYRNPATGTTTYTPQSSFVNNKGKLKLPWKKIKLPPVPEGSAVDTRALNDLTKYLSNKEIKYMTQGTPRTKKGVPLLDSEGNTIFAKGREPRGFGNVNRDYTNEDLPYLNQQLQDAFITNNTKVPLSQLFRERKLEGGMFSRKANKSMDAKLNSNVKHRKQVVDDIKMFADSTDIDNDKMINAYSYLSGDTNHTGALSRLERAIVVHKTGKQLPEAVYDNAGRVINEIPENKAINTAAQFFGPFGTGSYTGQKKNLLSEVLKNFADPSTGIDSSVIDKGDIFRGLNIEPTTTSTIPNYVFGSEPLYNSLIDKMNTELGSGFVNDFVSPYANNRLSNIQQILRLRSNGSN